MFARRLLRAAPYATKTTTGLVGVRVEPNAHLLLREVYQTTLDNCAVMPDTFLYKKVLVEYVNTRLKVLSESSDHAVIEKRFDDGRQIEESLEHAKDELELVGELIRKQAWLHINADADMIILPPGVHHEDRLDLSPQPPAAAAAAAAAKQ